MLADSVKESCGWESPCAKKARLLQDGLLGQTLFLGMNRALSCDFPCSKWRGRQAAPFWIKESSQGAGEPTPCRITIKKTSWPESSLSAAAKRHITDPTRQGWTEQNTRQGAPHGLPFFKRCRT